MWSNLCFFLAATSVAWPFTGPSTIWRCRRDPALPVCGVHLGRGYCDPGSAADLGLDARRVCQAGVHLGDRRHKVVDRGKGDEVFITTPGMGLLRAVCNLSIQSASPGDRVLVSGTIGDHGVAIMSTREGISLRPLSEAIEPPLNRLTGAMLALARRFADADPDRGGLASTLNELAPALVWGSRSTNPRFRFGRSMVGV